MKESITKVLGKALLPAGKSPLVCGLRSLFLRFACFPPLPLKTIQEVTPSHFLLRVLKKNLSLKYFFFLISLLVASTPIY